MCASTTELSLDATSNVNTHHQKYVCTYLSGIAGATSLVLVHSTKHTRLQASAFSITCMRPQGPYGQACLQTVSNHQGILRYQLVRETSRDEKEGDVAVAVRGTVVLYCTGATCSHCCDFHAVRLLHVRKRGGSHRVWSCDAAVVESRHVRLSVSGREARISMYVVNIGRDEGIHTFRHSFLFCGPFYVGPGILSVHRLPVKVLWFCLCYLLSGTFFLNGLIRRVTQGCDAWQVASSSAIGTEKDSYI